MSKTEDKPKDDKTKKDKKKDDKKKAQVKLSVFEEDDYFEEFELGKYFLYNNFYIIYR